MQDERKKRIERVFPVVLRTEDGQAIVRDTTGDEYRIKIHPTTGWLGIERLQ